MLLVNFIGFTNDSSKPTALVSSEESKKIWISKWYKSKVMIILLALIICIGISVVGFSIHNTDIQFTKYPKNNINAINYTYPGSKMLKLLSNGINTINNETFAVPLTQYNSKEERKLFSSLYSAIKTDDILSLLDLDNPIHGQYPNLSDNKCQLLLHNISFRATNYKLQNKMQSVFNDIITDSMRYYEIDFQLSRFDLFHGHFFYNNDTKTAGILFHAMEYPQLSALFPYHLGFCQQDSTCIYHEYYWSFRNALLIMNNEKKNDNDKKKYNHINTQLWLLDTSNGSYIQLNVMQPYALTIFVDDIGIEVGELYDFNDTQLLWQTFKPMYFINALD